uniref:Uncharacterized protein n=1 Tax=Arundo donax TaxID=35708 RepID=A0A0A9AP86_ARUDO
MVMIFPISNKIFEEKFVVRVKFERPCQVKRRLDSIREVFLKHVPRYCVSFWYAYYSASSCYHIE